MRTAKAQISADQGLCYSQTESLDTIKCFNGDQMPGFAHVQDDVNPHILHLLERGAWSGSPLFANSLAIFSRNM